MSLTVAPCSAEPKEGARASMLKSPRPVRPGADVTTPACRPHVNAGHDPWWTYDELGGGDPDTRRNTKAAIAAEAKAICATCPVQAACLQAAIDSGEGYGIWGGKTPAQRAQMDSATDLPHGTYGALKRHARAGEPQCAECRRFNARKQREAAQRKAAS